MILVATWSTQQMCNGNIVVLCNRPVQNPVAVLIGSDATALLYSDCDWGSLTHLVDALRDKQSARLHDLMEVADEVDSGQQTAAQLVSHF